MVINRKTDETVYNKLEQLSRFLHVKKIGGELRLLEFFIPKKFKVGENLDNDEIFNDLVNVDTVWITDEYDGRYGYKVDKYYKYLDHDDQYDVLKFYANKIQNMN